MNALDKKILSLFEYKPELTKQKDFDEFWDNVLAKADSKPLSFKREPLDTPLPYIDAYKIEYTGFDDTKINSLFLLPNFISQEALPCIVFYHGYLDSKGLPEKYSQWLLMGIAVLAIDIRGQGGETGNNLAYSHGSSKGWITQGILDKNSCYYLAASVDCIKAVDLAYLQPEVDRSRICVLGTSQGGGLTLLAAALNSKASLAVAGVPNMCHMDLAIFSSTGSISEAAEFANRHPEKLQEVLATLSYFDNMNLAERIKIPVLVSAAMKDPICPADTVFAAYNRINSDKRIEVYPFSGHALLMHFNREMMDFIATRFNISRKRLL